MDASRTAHFLEESYLLAYPDVAKAVERRSLTSGLQHFDLHGKSEGRLYDLSSREALIRRASKEGSILEVGPFYTPTVRGGHVKYFDVLSQEQLIARATALSQSVDQIPHIDFVSPNGDLGIVSDKFDAAISSHCLEHQPDVVLHLRQISRLLNERGRYYLIVPDKRYCFDHFIVESSIADILEAHLSNRRLHTLASVIEHRALTCHNAPSRHWDGDHGAVSSIGETAQRIRAAIHEYNSRPNQYIDVHAWQFTPESFGLVLELLNELDLVDLRLLYVGETLRGRNEFVAVLEK